MAGSYLLDCYTRHVPVDFDARVLANRRLSPDYHVLALGAPEIAAATEPGQFVMVKAGHDLEPLRRRPFSVF
jgi:dihydroorotate dehydrogenase electron transfer subunit